MGAPPPQHPHKGAFVPAAPQPGPALPPLPAPPFPFSLPLPPSLTQRAGGAAFPPGFAPQDGGGRPPYPPRREGGRVGLLLRRLSGGPAAAEGRMTEDWGGLAAAVAPAAVPPSAQLERGEARRCLPPPRPLRRPLQPACARRSPALTQFPLSPGAKPTDVTQHSPSPPPPPPPFFSSSFFSSSSRPPLKAQPPFPLPPPVPQSMSPQKGHGGRCPSVAPRFLLSP